MIHLFNPEDGSELFLGDDGYYHSETSDSVFEIFEGKPLKVDRESMYNSVDEEIINEDYSNDSSISIPLHTLEETEKDYADENELALEESEDSYSSGTGELYDLDRDSEGDLFSKFFSQWKKITAIGLDSRIEDFDIDSESIKKDIMYFAQLESKRNENSDPEETKKYFKEYLHKISDIYNSDNSSNVSIHSTFRIDGDRCTHVVEKVGDNFSSILMCGSFNYDEEFIKGLLIPAIVGYSRRNSLSFADVSPNPRKTSVFFVRSYSNNGNSLSVENIDERFAKEIKYNIEKIPALLYGKKNDAEKLNHATGYVGLIELCLLTFAVTVVVGIILALEIMK